MRRVITFMNPDGEQGVNFQAAPPDKVEELKPYALTLGISFQSDV